MSGSPEDSQIHSAEIPAEESGDIPVLVAEDPSAPRIVLPVRRSTEAEVPPRAEAGLRIESRIHTQSSQESPQSGTTSQLEISELGKGVVRLGTETAVASPPRQENLPVMQPRPSRSAAQAARTAEAANWGQARGNSSRWMIWSGAAVAAAVVTALALQPLLSRKDPTPRATYYDKLQVVDDVTHDDDPMVYFNDHSDEVGQQMFTALTAYARARTVDEVIPLIRNGEHLRDELKRHWKPWNVPSDWTPPPEASQGYSSVGKLPYGMMSGSLPDFSPYAAYFVRAGDHMLVDWEATAGTGTTDMRGLNQAAATEAVVRVKIAPASFYTAAYPESDYLSFCAERGDSDATAWLYVERTSVAGETLGKLFQQGDILGRPDTSPQPIRLRLARNGQPSQPNQWLVLDVLHKGWVSP